MLVGLTIKVYPSAIALVPHCDCNKKYTLMYSRDEVYIKLPACQVLSFTGTRVNETFPTSIPFSYCNNLAFVVQLWSFMHTQHLSILAILRLVHLIFNFCNFSNASFAIHFTYFTMSLPMLQVEY